MDARSSGKHRDALLWGTVSFLALRLISSAAAVFSVEFITPGEHLGVPGYTPPTGNWLATVWLRSDALWYLRAAEQGYGQDLQGYAFYPAFPLFVRAFSFLLGNELYAGLFVASAVTLAGLILLYMFFEAIAGPRAARAGTVGFALFPTSFFLVAPYAESLLLVLGAGALLAAVKKKSAASFVLGFLAGITRPFGALLFIPLAVLARSKRLPRWWLSAASPIAGAVVWFTFVGIDSGDPLAALRVQSMWQRELTFFLWTPVSALIEAIRWMGNPVGPYFLADLAALAFSVTLVVVMLKRQSWGLGLYAAALLLFVLSTPFPPRPLLSLPRFILALFPLFLVYGSLSKWWLRLSLALSASGLAIGTAVFIAGQPLF